MSTPYRSAPKIPHLCLSSDPSCAGISPCLVCLEAIKMQVLPVAMANVGGPFSDPQGPWPERFIQGFLDRWREVLIEVIRQFEAHSRVNTTATETQTPEPPVTEEGNMSGAGYQPAPETMQKALEMLGRGPVTSPEEGEKAPVPVEGGKAPESDVEAHIASSEEKPVPVAGQEQGQSP